MRLIDADELWEKAKVRVEDNGGLSLPNLYWVIKGLPTIDAEIVRHGHWIDTGSGQRCSECHEIQYGHDNYRFYCPVCGAKMDKE